MRATLIKLVLIGVYPLLLLARLTAAARGQDPFRLRNPAGSCWIVRPDSPPARSYFSDAPRGSRTAALLALVAAVAALPKGERKRAGRPDAPGNQIPDEIYTLW